ncbi:MAG: apolipoprotein N-acyltransferase [Vulcanimicrobiota bacterium]
MTRLTKPLPFRWALLFSVAAALLLMLAFPFTRVFPLTLVCLVPLMLALRGQGWLRGLLFGLLFGFVYQSYIMFWANFFGPPAYLFLAGYKTVLPGFFGLLCAFLGRKRPELFPLAFVSGFVALEFLQTFGPFGVTWGMLSHAWARHPLLLQCCSLLGPWTLSLLLVLVNTSLFVSLVPEYQNQRRRWWLVTGLLWLGSLAFGGWRLGQDWGPGTTFTAGVAQNSMGRDVRWDPNFAQTALQNLEKLTLAASNRGARLVVWPETAIPYRGFRKLPNLTFEVGLLALKSKSYIIVGSIEKMDDEFNHTLNTASLVTPQGAFEGQYDKQRLVPGGEYLPLEKWLRPYKIFDRVMRYMPGANANGVFNCADLGIRPGMLICFESMVPYLAAQRVRDGSDVLVVATNDGWFGDNPAIAHHFEMAVFRAVEQGRPVIQCGNTGISGMIDERGRILEETPINQAMLAVHEVTARRQNTVYSRVGDILAWLALVVFLLCPLLPKGTQASAGKL